MDSKLQVSPLEHLAGLWAAEGDRDTKVPGLWFLCCGLNKTIENGCPEGLTVQLPPLSHHSILAFQGDCVTNFCYLSRGGRIQQCRDKMWETNVCFLPSLPLLTEPRGGCGCGSHQSNSRSNPFGDESCLWIRNILNELLQEWETNLGFVKLLQFRSLFDTATDIPVTQTCLFGLIMSKKNNMPISLLPGYISLCL